MSTCCTLQLCDKAMASTGRTVTGLTTGLVRVKVVHTTALGEALGDKAGFEFVDGAISLLLYFEHQPAADHVLARRPWHQCPCAITEKSRVLIFHGSTPASISKGSAVGSGCCKKSTVLVLVACGAICENHRLGDGVTDVTSWRRCCCRCRRWFHGHRCRCRCLFHWRRWCWCRHRWSSRVRQS